MAKMSCILEYLAHLAIHTTKPLVGTSLDEISSKYHQHGWQADEAVLKALEMTTINADVDVVSQVIQTLYLPWLEESARKVQELVQIEGYPMRDKWIPDISDHQNECLLFVDGLRLDMAKRLIRVLNQGGFQIAASPQFSALPSVTASAKPAVSPVAGLICGTELDQEFQPSVCDTGQPLSHYHFKRILKETGWTFVENSITKPAKNDSGWHEFGDIDREGHSKGWKLSKYIDSFVDEIKGRIEELLSAGWKRVRIVTDHGWLLMPGGLPKVELSSVLTENKWGRCALLKPGATCDESLYPWYWNPIVQVALADGVGCYKKGVEYAHGGLSVQECCTLQIVVEKSSRDVVNTTVSIHDVVWRGLRCHVVLDSDVENITLDIRLQSGNADSSVVVKQNRFQNEDAASVIIENDALEGEKAVIVLLNAEGKVISEQKTIIGGV
jgi:hypothetical protein